MGSNISGPGIIFETEIPTKNSDVILGTSATQRVSPQQANSEPSTAAAAAALGNTAAADAALAESRTIYKVVGAGTNFTEPRSTFKHLFWAWHLVECQSKRFILRSCFR